jgi:hypothetical protein
MPQPRLLRLIDALRQCLAQKPDGYSEFELIQTLSAPPYQILDATQLRETHSLFQLHFILFHALYHLRDSYHLDKTGHLEIGPLIIRNHPYFEAESALAPPDPLRDYYLDWTNFENTTTEDIEAMLNQFWQKIGGASLSQENYREALAVLELNPPANYAQVKQQYRRLMMQHHPDRGGDATHCQRIQRAMDQLETCFNPVRG